MPKLTTIQRAQIIGLYDVPGQTPATIAQRFGVSKSTVTRLRQKYLQTNDVVDLPRSGRPRVTSERENRFIQRTANQNRFQTGRVYFRLFFIKQ